VRINYLSRRIAQLETSPGLPSSAGYDRFGLGELAGEDLVYTLQNLLIATGRPVDEEARGLYDRATAVPGLYDLSPAETTRLQSAYVGDISTCVADISEDSDEDFS